MQMKPLACLGKTRTCLDRNCTDAYGYPKDDTKTTVCQNITADWEVTFCPTGSCVDTPGEPTTHCVYDVVANYRGAPVPLGHISPTVILPRSPVPTSRTSTPSTTTSSSTSTFNSLDSHFFTKILPPTPLYSCEPSTYLPFAFDCIDPTSSSYPTALTYFRSSLTFLLATNIAGPRESVASVVLLGTILLFVA